MAVSAISIANAALAEIGADSIASFDENGVAAREVNRVYDNVIADVLERHDFGFKIRRTNAVALTNDRPGEWAAAYVKPAATSKVLRVLPPTETSYPEWGIYAWPLWDALGPIPFLEVGGTIYTNQTDAILETTASSVEVTAFPPLVRRAVELELAARVAYPIKKDRALRGDMLQLAALALNQAIADDANRMPTQQVSYVSEAELARAGYERSASVI